MKNKGLIITMIILLLIIVVLLVGILCLGISGKISFMGFLRGKSKNIVHDEKYETEKIEKISVFAYFFVILQNNERYTLS